MCTGPPDLPTTCNRLACVGSTAFRLFPATGPLPTFPVAVRIDEVTKPIMPTSHRSSEGTPAASFTVPSAQLDGAVSSLLPRRLQCLKWTCSPAPPRRQGNSGCHEAFPPHMFDALKWG